MAEDKGKILDSINQVDEEVSLEKAKAQESLHDSNVREEHFKQNIMMDVEEFPEGVEAAEEILQEKELEEVALQNEQIEKDNPQNIVIDNDESNVKPSSGEESKAVEQQSSAIQNPGNSSNSTAEVGEQIQESVPDHNVVNGTQGVSAFDQVSVDQEIEEAVLFSDDPSSNESSPQTDTEDEGDDRDSVNTAPNALDSSATANEDNLLIGQLIATDADDGDVLSFSLISNPAQGSVTVDTDGAYSFTPGDEFQDLAEGESRTVTFNYRVTDEAGASDTAEMTIVVTGSNDGPVAIALTDNNVDENSTGAVVGDLSTNDVDVNDSHAYTVDDSRFEVVNNGGNSLQLKLKDGVSLDHESSNTVNLTITSTDEGGLSTSQVIEINVVDINEAPTNIDLDALNTVIPTQEISLGNTGNGVVGQDGATGAGYIMYSEESVHTRFGNVHSQSADNFVSVKHIDGKWYYDTNITYIEFTPDTSDRLIAEVDFGADTVSLLSGINDPTYQIEGINAGYQSGDLQITPNIWNGSTNYGEFRISGDSFFVVTGDEIASVDENLAGAIVGDLSADDVDVNDSHTYTVNDSRFEVVDDGSGQMVLKLKDDVSLDHETETLIDVTVTATDSGGLSTTQDFSMNVANVNEMPVIEMLNGNVVSENAGNYVEGISIGSFGNGVVGQDGATGAGYIMYSEESVHTRFGNVHSQSADNFVSVKHIDGKWYYDTNSRYVEFTPDTSDRLVAEVDFGADTVSLLSGINDPTYQIEGINAGYQSGDLQITPNVWNGTTAGPAPGEFGISGSQIFVSSASVVGIVSASDVDGDSLIYSLIDDADGRFGINSETGEIYVIDGSKLDFESSSQHQITVEVVDGNGGTDTQDYIIYVKDAGEFDVSAVTDNDTATNEVGESVAIGTSVGVTAFAEDQDDSDSVSYSLTSNPNSAFAIDATTGEVTVADPSGLDFESAQTMQIEVTATSTDGSTSNETFNIAITDDNSEFSISAVSDADTDANTINESASVGDTVGVTAFASDADDSDSVTYSLTNNPNNAFAIDADTGEVTVADPSGLDFETAQTMQIEVTAISTDGSTSNETFDISVTDDNSEFSITAVTDSDTDANKINESASIGDTVGVTSFASDADDSDSVSYSLTSNPNNAFAIDADTGEVAVADPNGLDFETATTMQIEVTATSTDGSTSNETFDIAITDDNSEFSITAVTDSDSDANSISESASIGDSVGVTAFASDADDSDSVTYSLTNNPNNAFAIDADTGEVTVADPTGLDFETAQTMRIEVTATSIDGSTSNETFDISITDDNSEFSISAVSDTDTDANTINESANIGDSVGVTAFANDADDSDSVTYSLTKNPNNAFAIDADTGEVTVADPSGLDFETTQTMQIEVTATSTDGSSSSETFDISITDDNSEFSITAVTDSDSDANSINESASIGDTVGVTAFAQDQDDSDSVTYSLTSNPNNAFTIEANTGEVTVADPNGLDFESAQTMQIEVTATSTDGSTSNETFNISITDDNSEFAISAVTDSDSTANSINESAAIGDTVGVTAFANDADDSDSVSYSLTSNPNNAFAIDADTGEVTVADPSGLDFETAQSMQIEVTATSTDGSTLSETFDISITDDNSEFTISAVSDSDTTANSIGESASIGDTVGVTAFAQDQDDSDSVTYSLSSNPNNAFAIDATTGEVTVADPNGLDFETAQTMQIEVTATSTDGSTSNETFNISVMDDNSEFTISAVTDTDVTANSINESASIGDTVGVTAFASDADDSDSVTYSLTSNPNNAFVIDATTGEVTVADPNGLDFESAQTMQIEVTATSTDGSTSSQTFDISITDADEFDVSAIVDTDAAVNEVSESAVAGANVGITAFAEDLDGTNNDVTYSLTNDAGGVFTIDANTGEVTVADPSGLDFETAQNMQIEVTATSQDGSTSSESFTVNISNVNENPVITKVEVSDILSSFNQYDLVIDPEGTTGSFGENVNVSAFQPGGDASQLIVSTDGIGIQSTNVTNDIARQIDYDPTTGTSEQLVLDFINPVENLQLTTGKQYPSEGGVGEQGIWTAYDAAGNVVGSGELDPGLGTNVASNSYQYEINADAPISRIVIEANDYSDSDFSLVSIQYNETLEIPLIDGENITLDISESVSTGSAVADVSAFDVDGDDLSFSIAAGNDDGAFAIDSASGVITVVDTNGIDAEALSERILTITVNDGNGGSDSVDFVFNIVDENEFSISAVNDIDNAINEVSESAIVGSTVGVTAFASDADSSNNTITYSLSSNPNNAFAIDANTGKVTVADPGSLDFETAQTMQIEVTATSADGSMSAQTFNIAITDDNSEFTISAVTDSNVAVNSVNENAANGTTVGITALASDQDATDNVTYTLSDDAGGRFAIDANSGEVSVADGSLLDYETANSHNVTVLATSDDGSTSSETFTINVADVNENSVPTDIKFTGNDSLDISSNGSMGTAVVTGHIRNSGSNTSVDHWSITHNGGELTIDVLANGYNSGSLDSYVRVFRDNGDGTYTQVALNDDGSAGADGSSGSVDSYINQSNLSAGDYIVAISGYHLNASEAKATSDYPNRSSSTGPYQITITGDTIVNGIATNPSGGGDWGNPQNDAVVVDSGDVLETIAAGSVVASVASVVDADSGDTHTFALTDDASGKFAIDSSSGEISLVAQHDATSIYSDSVTVQVTDSAGETYSETVGIHLGTNSTSGVTGTINSSNYSQTGNGYTVTAKNVVGGTQTSASVDNVSVSGSALGADGTVSDTDSGRSNQIAYDKASGLSEEFIVDFDNDLSSADVSFMNLFTSSYGEVGHWAAYHDGVLVAEGDFTETSSGSGTLNIDPGEAFNQIVMSANLQTDRSDGSDYQISGISYTEMPVGDEITGTSNDDIIYGFAGDDVLAGGDGNDIFIFDQGDGNDSVNGGAGDGWVDSIDLSAYAEDASDPSSPWQIEVDGAAVDYDINASLLELGDDVSGVIQFDDGSQLTFENIENIEW